MCIRDSELTDEQKLSLIEFIFKNWKNDKKTIIKSIDWSKISDTETSKLLGFNPSSSVFPNKFANESEQLPAYLIKWIGKDEEREKFISDLKVNAESSFIVALRNYFKSGGEFQKSRIAKEGNQELLFNSFKWMKENNLHLKNEEPFTIFYEIVNVINNKRKDTKIGELILENNFDFEKLSAESVELEEDYYLKWKENLEDKFSICLFNGELPKTIRLDEIEDYIFWNYFADDIAVSDENIIYINNNKKEKFKELLSGLVSEGKMSHEELLQLYQSGDNENKQNSLSLIHISEPTRPY